MWRIVFYETYPETYQRQHLAEGSIKLIWRTLSSFDRNSSWLQLLTAAVAASRCYRKKSLGWLEVAYIMSAKFRAVSKCSTLKLLYRRYDSTTPAMYTRSLIKGLSYSDANVIVTSVSWRCSLLRGAYEHKIWMISWFQVCSAYISKRVYTVHMPTMCALWNYIVYIHKRIPDFKSGKGWWDQKNEGHTVGSRGVAP